MENDNVSCRFNKTIISVASMLCQDIAGSKAMVTIVRFVSSSGFASLGSMVSLGSSKITLHTDWIQHCPLSCQSVLCRAAKVLSVGCGVYLQGEKKEKSNSLSSLEFQQS